MQVFHAFAVIAIILVRPRVFSCPLLQLRFLSLTCRNRSVIVRTGATPTSLVFIECLRSLIDGAQSRKIPIIQIFHVEDSGPFSLESGYVVPLQDLSFTPDAVFQKRSHSALVGSG